MSGSPTRGLRAPEAPLQRPTFRKTTRAHVAIGRRPRFRVEVAQALGPTAATMTTLLGCPFTVTGSLLETDARPPRSLSEFSTFAIFELVQGGARAALEVERSFLCYALGRLSGETQTPGPATRLTRIEQVAFGYLCLTLLSALRDCPGVEGLFAPRLLATTDDRKEALARVDSRTAHVAVELRLEMGPKRGMARLFVPAAAAQRAAQSFPEADDVPMAAELERVEMEFATFAGRATLPFSAWANLSSGDVVVFSGVECRAGTVRGAGVLRASGFELIGRLEESAFTFHRATRRALAQEHRMSEPSNPDRTVTALPLEVEVELTRLRLTLAELSGLRPGAIIPLRINTAEPVLLRVGDRVVARAELVDIENELGARILSFVPERAS